MITVDGKKCKVIEDLGYVPDRDQYAKAVIIDGKERIVVKDPFRGALWRLAGVDFGFKGHMVGQTTQELRSA